MRRLLATTSLALTFVAAPACKKEEQNKDTAAKADGANAKPGGEAAAPGSDQDADADDAARPDAPALTGLVTDGADMMAVMDLQAIIGSGLYQAQAAALEASPFGQNITAAKACNLGPQTWKHLVFGAESSNGEAMVMGMSATGVGVKANIECMAAKYKEQDPTTDWKIEEKDGRLMVTVNGGEATAYALDDDTLVMVGRPWGDKFQELLDGKGTAAVTGQLKDAVALADTSKHLYFVGVPPADSPGGQLEGAQHFGVSIDLASGVALMAKIAFPDAATATARAETFNATFQEGKALAGSLGIPPAVVQSVKIAPDDSAVKFEVRASAQEMAAMAAMAMATIPPGGVPGAAPGQPVPGSAPGTAPGAGPGAAPGGL